MAQTPQRDHLDRAIASGGCAAVVMERCIWTCSSLYRGGNGIQVLGVRYWLVKTEPEKYGWQDLVGEGQACWDGVRNVEARNNLRAMALGDRVLVYHSGKPREVVGLAEVVRTAYRDPSSNRAIWSAVDLSALTALPNPVSLSQVKADPGFANCPLVQRARLSVMSLTEEHYQRLLALGGATKLAPPQSEADELDS